MTIKEYILHKFVSNAYSHISSISLGRCIGVSIINLSSLIIKTFTYNILRPFSMTILSRWVLVSGGGGGGRVLKKCRGTIKWSPYSINPRYL